MDIHATIPRMKKKPKKRPGILIRMYSEDITNLNRVCAERCTPRENYARRAILAQVQIDLYGMGAISHADATKGNKPDPEEPPFDTPTTPGPLRKIKAKKMVTKNKGAK